MPTSIRPTALAIGQVWSPPNRAADAVAVTDITPTSVRFIRVATGARDVVPVDEFRARYPFRAAAAPVQYAPPPPDAGEVPDDDF